MTFSFRQKVIVAVYLEAYIAWHGKIITWRNDIFSEKLNSLWNTPEIHIALFKLLNSNTFPQIISDKFVSDIVVNFQMKYS